MYEGDIVISGVLGIGVLIKFYFWDIVGFKMEGNFLFIGNVCDNINGVEVILIDCVMLIVIVEVLVMGKMGCEINVEFEDDVVFFKWFEEICCKVGEMMGFGNVVGWVIFKFVIVSLFKNGGNIIVRYFVFIVFYLLMVVMGGISISVCSVFEGMVVYDVVVNF